MSRGATGGGRMWDVKTCGGPVGGVDLPGRRSFLMSYSASHGAPLILMLDAVSLHLEPPFPPFSLFLFFSQTFFVPRKTASPRAMRAMQDKKRRRRRRSGGEGGGGGSVFLDETESYISSSAALFYSLLSFHIKSHPHQLVVGVEEGGGLSVFNATFSKSSIDAV